MPGGCLLVFFEEVTSRIDKMSVVLYTWIFRKQRKAAKAHGFGGKAQARTAELADWQKTKSGNKGGLLWLVSGILQAPVEGTASE